MNNKIDDLEDPFLPPPPPEINVPIDNYNINDLPKVEEDTIFNCSLTVNTGIRFVLNNEAKKHGIKLENLRDYFILTTNSFTSGLSFYLDAYKRKVYFVEHGYKYPSYTHVADIIYLHEENGCEVGMCDIDVHGDTQIGPYADVELEKDKK